MEKEKLKLEPLSDEWFGAWWREVKTVLGDGSLQPEEFCIPIVEFRRNLQIATSRRGPIQAVVARLRKFTRERLIEGEHYQRKRTPKSLNAIFLNFEGFKALCEEISHSDWYDLQDPPINQQNRI